MIFHWRISSDEVNFLTLWVLVLTNDAETMLKWFWNEAYLPRGHRWSAQLTIDDQIRGLCIIRVLCSTSFFKLLRGGWFLEEKKFIALALTAVLCANPSGLFSDEQFDDEYSNPIVPTKKHSPCFTKRPQIAWPPQQMKYWLFGFWVALSIDQTLFTSPKMLKRILKILLVCANLSVNRRTFYRFWVAICMLLILESLQLKVPALMSSVFCSA